MEARVKLMGHPVHQMLVVFPVGLLGMSVIFDLVYFATNEQVFEVVVPTQEEIEIRNGQRHTVQKKVFPGYVLVRMDIDEETWYQLRNTPGVTGFISINNKPVPLGDEEARGILKGMTAEAPKVAVSFQLGDSVRIIDGPFADFRGQIDEINHEKGKIKVLVSFFGRETPVELDFLQAEKET